MNAPKTFAAIYDTHYKAMWRTAAALLRPHGLESETADAVQDAVTSILTKPPTTAVNNWEAFLVTAATRKAKDRIKSARVQHAGPEFDTNKHDTSDPDFADDVADAVDRQRAAAIVPDLLAVLDSRDRQIVWKYVALGRPRTEVAEEFGVSPGRVSQVAKESLMKLKTAADQRKE